MPPPRRARQVTPVGIIEMPTHAGVRKREKRHDYITHPRMKLAIQAGFKRKTFLRGLLHRTVKLNALIPVDLRSAFQKIRRVDHEVIDFTFRNPGSHRSEQAESDTGERRMNAALHKRIPDKDRENSVDKEVADAEAERKPRKSEEQERNAERNPVDRTGIAEGDGDDRSEIVRDGERENHDAETLRNSIPQHHHAADDERDIRSHRNAPAGGRFRRSEKGINKRRAEHTARGGDDRKARCRYVMKSTVNDFAFGVKA